MTNPGLANGSTDLGTVAVSPLSLLESPCAEPFKTDAMAPGDPAPTSMKQPGVLKGIMQICLMLILTVSFTSGASWMTKSIVAMKTKPVAVAAVRTAITPEAPLVCESSESSTNDTSEEAILAEIVQLKKSVSEQGIGERELADRFQLSADCLQRSISGAASNWSPDVRKEARETVVEFYTKSAHIYKALESISNELAVYEKLEMRLVAPDNVMKRHLKLLSDTRLSSDQVANSAIPLGLAFIEQGDYASAEQSWIKGLDRAAGKEINAGLRLSRLLGDLYAADKRFGAEEPCRKLAVRLGLQCTDGSQDLAVREDTVKWQKCLHALGKHERANRLNKYLASPNIHTLWSAIDGTTM